MPQTSQYTVDPLLTRIAKAYTNRQMIADTLMPRVNVDSATGKYYVYDKSKFRIEPSLRAGISRANRVDFNMSLANYGPLVEHSLEQGITDAEKRTLGEDRARRLASMNVMQKIMLNHEKSVADLLTSTSVLTQNTSLADNNRWDVAHADSTPINDIMLGKDTILATGIPATRFVLAMSYPVYSKLRVNQQVMARIAYNSVVAPASKQQLEALFDVDEIIVGSALYDTAKEGQTASLSYLWGKNAILLAYANTVEEEPSISQIAPGYTLQIPEERYVDRWDDRSQKTEFVRASDQFEAKLVAVEAGYLIATAIS